MKTANKFSPGCAICFISLSFRAMKTSARLSDKLIKHIGHALILSLLLLPAVSPTICAQDNYEIQVYGSDTIPAGVTMVELHNNFTSKGEKKVVDVGISHSTQLSIAHSKDQVRNAALSLLLTLKLVMSLRKGSAADSSITEL